MFKTTPEKMYSFLNVIKMKTLAERLTDEQFLEWDTEYPILFLLKIILK
jgi:hypothetical protein